MSAFDRNYFNAPGGGMGFIPLLVGAIGAGAGAIRQRKARKAADKAAKQAKKLAAERAASAERIAKMQLEASKGRGKLPSWVLPVAIGSGVLLLGLGGLFLHRRR